MQKIDDASRYLQFWIVHSFLSFILGTLSPLLAWVPLSTHATWFIWAYVQMESPTRTLYSLLENELCAVGLISFHGEKEVAGSIKLGRKSLEDTAVVRSVKRIIAALPSDVQSESLGMHSTPEVCNDSSS